MKGRLRRKDGRADARQKGNKAGKEGRKAGGRKTGRQARRKEGNSREDSSTHALAFKAPKAHVHPKSPAHFPHCN